MIDGAFLGYFSNFASIETNFLNWIDLDVEFLFGILKCNVFRFVVFGFRSFVVCQVDDGFNRFLRSNVTNVPLEYRAPVSK